MKKKKKKLIILGFIFIVSILIVIGISSDIINIEEINENVRKSLYGNPIDLETGIINNKYFNINSEREVC